MQALHETLHVQGTALCAAADTKGLKGCSVPALRGLITYQRKGTQVIQIQGRLRVVPSVEVQSHTERCQ